MKNRRFLIAVLVLLISGCGYTHKVTLPNAAKTVFVPMFKNSIPPENILTYVAGLETDITQAVVDELVRDGNLKVVDSKNAELLLRGEIVGYEQEAFRFNRFEQVDEFRLFMVVKLTLEDAKTGNILWKENNFSGDTQYFVNGPRAIPEEQAAHRAIFDLAEKIVNRVVEDW